MPQHPGGDTLLRIFSSSGTTGQPKYIPWSHKLFCQMVTNIWLDEGANHGTRLVAIPLGGPTGMMAALRCLYDGATLLISDLAQAGAALRRHGATSMSASPFALRQLLDALPENAPGFPALRTIDSAGARIPPALADALQRRLGGTLLSHYGATETGRATTAPFTEIAGRPGAAGFLVPGVTLQTVDDTGTPLPEGATGIIRLRTELMVPAYACADPAEPSSLRDGWFYPGDIGRLDRDLMLILEGRSAELINSGGVKINPAEIEDALLTLPGVTDAAAFGVPDPLGITQPWAAITASRPVPREELDALFARLLSGPTTPRQILQVPQMPRTPNGKIRKEMLVAFALTQQGQQ